MNVTQYLFQSPSPNPVQVGRLDPSSKEEVATTTEDAPKQSVVKENPLKEVSTSDFGVKSTITPRVDQSHLLDLYA